MFLLFTAGFEMFQVNSIHCY